MALPEHIERFRQGLYPILLAGDTSAFRHYLGQWGDVLGDTTELAETTDAQQRVTMEALLRRPRQFNLPPWPRVATESHYETPAPVRLGGQRTELGSEAGSIASVPAPSDQQRTLDAISGVQPAEGHFQLDMLTGELVPVAHDAHAHPMTNHRPLTRRTRRRGQRTESSELAQLRLWNAENSS